MTYQVNEIFVTVQGEGIHTGKKASFIRLQGCTVGCPWCDSGPLADQAEGRHTNGLTRNTWGRGGTRMTVDEIIFEVQAHWEHTSDWPHVVITGGEPTLYNLDELINALRDAKAFPQVRPFIQLETSGQNALKGVERPDWVTWSPKKNIEYSAPTELMELVDEIKFVVDEELPELTIVDIESLMGQLFSLVPYIVLMPEGCPPTKESMTRAYNLVMAHPEWRVMDRLQYRLGVR